MEHGVLPAAAAVALLTGNAWAETPVAPVSVDEVVVTATRSEKSLLEVPAAVTAQNLDQLRQQGFTHGTDEFRGVPGVHFRRGEGDGDEFPSVTVRGITGNHGNDTFLALVDSIPFVGPDEEVLLSQVPYAAVEKVEIVRGPVSALYGRGAIAGAVNYLTREPKTDANRLALGVGSHGYYRAEGVLERATDGRAFLGSVAYEAHEGWREHSARRSLNLFGKARFAIADRTTLTAYLDYIDRRGDIPGALPVSPDGRVTDVGGGRETFLGHGDTRNAFEGVLGALRLEHELSETLSITLTAHGRRFEHETVLNFYDPTGFDPARHVMGVNGFASDGTSSVAFGEAVANWKYGRHSLVAGASLEGTTLDKRESWTGQFGFTPACGFAYFLIEIDYTTGRTLNADHPCFVRNQLQAEAESRNRFWSVFAQDEVSLTERLTLTVGGRYDAFERKVTFEATGPFNPGGRLKGDASAFSPKAALSWRYGPGQLYAAYGRGFNSNFGPVWQWDPSRYARAEKPTTIDSFEIGWKGRGLDGRLQFETAAFHLVQRNRRVFIDNPDPTGPPQLATTGQRYTSRGVEAAVTFQATPDTSLRATYTWLDPKWDAYVVETAAGPIDLSGTTPRGVPRHMAYLALEHRFAPWLSGRAGYEWYGDYQVTEDNSVQGGSYGLLTLSATIEPPGLEGLALDVSVTNAMDENYVALFGDRAQATHATPGPPRQLRATLRARF